MKRKINELDFFQCPSTEVEADQRGGGGITHTGLPLIPTDGDGVVENIEPVSQRQKLKKAMKVVVMIALAALFIGFILTNLDLFKIGEITPFGKW